MFTWLALVGILAWPLSCLSSPDTASTLRPVGDSEAAIAEIERMAFTRHWRESEAAIDALLATNPNLHADQHLRIAYVQTRNVALSGDQRSALEQLAALLQEDLPGDLRRKVLTTGISLAANLGDWGQAFLWLNEGMTLVDRNDPASIDLLSTAAYLYTMAGEPQRGVEISQLAVDLIEAGEDVNPAALCRALSDLSLSQERDRRIEAAISSRNRQEHACRAADDAVFLSDAVLGQASLLLQLGRQEEALRLGREARRLAEAAGYEPGKWSANLKIARALVGIDSGSVEALNLLLETLNTTADRFSAESKAEGHELLGDALRQRDEHALANDHYRKALAARSEAEREARDRRLGFQQSEFELALMDERIQRLEAEKEVASLALAANQRWRWMLAVGALGMLVIALLLAGLLRRSIRERRRYRWLSEHDGLTRLLNYRRLRQLGQDAFDRFALTGHPLTAVIADIDFFKQVNDRYGHAAGDAVLQALGGWITEVIGERGIAGRSGGEEFTFLLDEDPDRAVALIEALRIRIAPVAVFDEWVNVTLSFGVAQAGDKTLDLEQLLSDADSALYDAKSQGRNCVVVAGRTSADGRPARRANAGSLVVVGCGIQFCRHASERTISEIQRADTVFSLADSFSTQCIRDIRSDTFDLTRHYAVGKDRRETYGEMEDEIMAAVRAGKQVCAVFYGHPGVFADVPHRIMRLTREAGLEARMEPGISAEACLFADIGIDPGRNGLQSMESTWFLINDVALEPASLVLLWQVALTGDMECQRFHAEPRDIKMLVEKLLRWYPADHQVILYEAALTPLEDYRTDRLRLIELPRAAFNEHTTLVIPPVCGAPESTDRFAAAADNPPTEANAVANATD